MSSICRLNFMIFYSFSMTRKPQWLLLVAKLPEISQVRRQSDTLLFLSLFVCYQKVDIWQQGRARWILLGLPN